MSNFHFIAIGGAVMHQLAIQLSKQGNTVTGSDDIIFDPAASNLKVAGIFPKSNGWDVNNIHSGIDCIILGMHAKADNPELLRAKELNIPVLSFPEFIAQLSQNKTRIVVAGSHGKTTTTSMLMYSLKEAGIEFDYLVGSKVKGFDLSVKVTKDAPYIIIEGDEYLSSPLDRRSKFLHYKPHIAIITGIAWDHINVFPTFESYTDTFKKFIESIVPGGHLIYFQKDSVLNELIQCNNKITRISYDFFPHEYIDGKTFLIENDKRFEVDFFGKHNMSNLAAVSEVVNLLKIDRTNWLNSLKNYSIAASRLEKIYESVGKNIVYFKDFAHAPSKLTATVKAAREKYSDYNILAIFELHTFSSLQTNFLPHYKDSLSNADIKAVFVSNKVLKQKGSEGISDDFIKESFGSPDLVVLHEIEELESLLSNNIKEKTIVLWMSSGNFDGFDLKKYIEDLA